MAKYLKFFQCYENRPSIVTSSVLHLNKWMNKLMKETVFPGSSLLSGLQQKKEQKLLDIASHSAGSHYETSLISVCRVALVS
jgi:hypothetical protein